MTQSWVFVTDPLAQLNVKKDSTIVMMHAAQQRGYSVGVIEDGGLSWAQSTGVVGCIKWVQVDLSNSTWWQVQSQGIVPLKDVGVVVMRKDPPFDAEYVASTWLLEQAQREGARVVNHPAAIRDHNEKFAIAQFQQFTAPTLVTRCVQAARAFAHEHQSAILKLLDGMGGRSVFRLEAADPNLGVILETLSCGGRNTLMVQKYIPEIVDGDKRVLLINGKPVPYALARVPQLGDHRGNLAAGGMARAQALTQRDLEIANTLGPVLRQRGLFLVGLDIIGNYLTEVNVTSPTCFREIHSQTGFDVANFFVNELSDSLANLNELQPPGEA
jgi:glutathione synthase